VRVFSVPGLAVISCDEQAADLIQRSRRRAAAHDGGVAHPSGVMRPVRSNDVVLVIQRGPAATHSAVAGKGSVTAETPVLDTLAHLTAASAGHNSPAPREFMLVRMAALIAVDAPPASYLPNADATADGGVTADDIQGVMIAVARL
jgi:hypothetical protein